MANTYTQLYIQLIFVVENRASIITTNIKNENYKYIGGILGNKKHKLIVINGMPDHLHILIGLNPDEAISSLVKEVKRCTTVYINDNHLIHGKFSWQKGYAAFSYSKSSLPNVIKYIENQEGHHKIKSFKDEYIEFLQNLESIIVQILFLQMFKHY